MLRLAKFIYDMGRRKGYSEAINELEHLQATITRSREGTIVRREVLATIERLKSAQKADEVYNDKANSKNIMVYDFMRTHAENADTANVKAIYNAHKDEIAQRFGIGGYQTFNWHVRRVIDWKMQTGDDVEVIGLNSEGTNG